MCKNIGLGSSLGQMARTIAGDHDFTMKAFDDRTVIMCNQTVPWGDWFCCKQCININSTLQKWIDTGDLFLPEDFLKKIATEQVLDLNYELDIKWRTLNGGGATKATIAVSIFQNRFDPIADSTTAFVDLISHLVYEKSVWRPFRGQDYGGMHCAIFMIRATFNSRSVVL